MGMIRLLCMAFLVSLVLSLFTSVEGGAFSASATIQSDTFSHVTPKYDRIKEAERACEEVIDCASELGSNNNRIYSSISDDLSFTGGDWDQKPGTSRPLLPFVDSVRLDNSAMSIHGSPFKLATFGITDVNYAHQSKQTVGVNGVLDLVITRNGPLPETESSEMTTQFQMWTGHTQVSVFFQGVYTETEENGGERVLCLLGSSMLPARQSDPAHPWIFVNSSAMRQDDQILLVLHYPLMFTLTEREIHGEMRSLSLKTGPKYFDNVQILSQLTSQKYKFGSQAVQHACDPYPYLDNLMAGRFDVYKGHDFCSLFEAFQQRARFVILPNWQCSGTDEFCSKLGPFVTNGTHGVLKDARLLMQNVHCEQRHAKGNVTMAKVSLVLRLVTNRGNEYLEMKRNGLGNMTLAAEGVWKSSNGQLCMVGCLGNAESSACNSRVCLYMPTAFSINQRSPLVGSISSINAKTPSYFPLSLQFETRFIPQSFYKYSNMCYKYSKIGVAEELMEKHESSSFGNTIKKSLLKYPRLEENKDYVSSYYILTEDLTFHARLVLDHSPSSRTSYINMQIFTVGPNFKAYSRLGNFSFAQAGTPYRENAEYTRKQLLVNISAQVSVYGEGYDNFSSLFVEGLYNPLVGKMYLIGCRHVWTSSKILLERADADVGFDCSTEVIISYPPATAQWLLNPAAGISITSQRREDDPFYFKPVQLKTLPITYRHQREAALSERDIESIFRVLALSMAVACILLQLIYLKHATDYVVYVSLVMLGIQALGYGVHLTTGVESLFKRKDSESQMRSSYYELNNNELFHVIGFTAKLLVLTAFLLTLRLLQKVWKSRVRLDRQELRRVPNEKLVLLITSFIHIFGFLCAFYVHSSKTRESPMLGEARVVSELEVVEISDSPKMQWMILVEEYMGVVQDMFLFPQVVGNVVWGIESKPLRKLYYIGLSLVRLVPHVYDYFKAPTLNPYFSRDYVFVNPKTDFYSKFSDVFIPTMTALLAVLVYMQQRWSCRLLPLHRKAYDKLPSASTIETELANTRDQ